MRFLHFCLLALLLSSGTVEAIEKLGYVVVQSHGKMELRRYDAHLLATVNVESDFEDAGGLAFRDLFNFIDGGNSSGTNIAMTAPVLQERSGNSWQVAFVMPAAFDESSLPSPVSQRVNIQSAMGTSVAAMTYSGNWSRERYLEKEALLRAAMADAGYEICGESIWARHNPPFMPGFLRTNEVLIPVCEKP